MKKILCVMSFLGIFSHSCFAQFYRSDQPLNISYNHLNASNRTISAPQNYNSLAHAGLFAGKLATQKYPLTAQFQYQPYAFQTKDSSLTLKNHELTIPLLTFATPERMVFSLFYGNDILSNDTLTLPLYRFGMGFAAQNSLKTFRFAFDFEGFAGKSRDKFDRNSGRFVLGADQVGISFGTSPSPLVRADIAVHASGFIDTLFGVAYGEERFSELTLPQMDFAVGIGDSTFPFQTAFKHTYGKKHFVYAVEGGASDFYSTVIGAKPNTSQRPNADPIVTDSVSWHLQNLGNVPVNDWLTVRPGFDLGYFRNRYTRMVPGEENHPLEYGGTSPGFTWGYRSFQFGFGLSLEFLNAIDYWTEFQHANLHVDLTGEELHNYSSNYEDSYNRFSTGIELGVHKLPKINFPAESELFVDISFLSIKENAILGNQYGGIMYETSPFNHFTPRETGTQLYRYTPWETAKHSVKTNDFAIGIRGALFKKQLELLGRIHFLNHELFEVGEKTKTAKAKKGEITIVYNLPSSKKK